jgi:hypothetical protein
MDAQQKLKSLLDQLNTVIVGKSAQVQDAWPACWPAATC